MEGLEKRYRLTRAIGSRFTGGYRLRREPVLRSSTSVLLSVLTLRGDGEIQMSLFWIRPNKFMSISTVEN
jgi:hypothetical protein